MLKIFDVDAFLSTHGGGFTIWVDILKLVYHHKEMAWHFAHLARHESTTYMCRYTYYALHKKDIFDWGELVSNEISQ
jgi:hypothetical protein